MLAVMTIILVWLPIYNYNRVKVGRKNLLKLAEERHWHELIPQNISFNKQYFVIVDAAQPSLVFTDKVTPGTYAKTLEERYRFYQSGNYIFAADRVNLEKNYLFSGN